MFAIQWFERAIERRAVMPFPVVLTRTIHVKLEPQGVTDVGLLLDRLEDGLANEHARRIKRTDSGIMFKAGILSFQSGWSLLTPITSGSVEVVRESHGARITYRLNFTEQCLAVTAIVVLMGWILLSSREVQFPKLEAVLSLAGIWVWMVWGNCALALKRFSRFLEKQSGP